jgi:hypothetical protein
MEAVHFRVRSFHSIIFERAGVNGDLNFLPGKSNFCIETPAAEANIS